MTRRGLRALARAVAGAVLLAQLSIAAYACPAMMPAPQATPPASAIADASPMTGCDEMAMDPSSANLCAEHCKYGQQSDHAPTLKVPAAVGVALYATPTVSEAAPPRRAAATMSALAAAWPPHAILHCVYRI